MRVPEEKQQAPEFWQNAPPQAVRAIELLARRVLQARERRLKAEQETNQVEPEEPTTVR